MTSPTWGRIERKVFSVHGCPGMDLARTWRNDVGCDVVLSHLLPEHACVVVHTRLGRRVDGACTAVGNPEGIDGRYVDDAPALALVNHGTPGMLAAHDSAVEIPIKHRTHVNVFDVHGIVGVRFAVCCGNVSAGVAHQDINAAYADTSKVEPAIASC